MDSIFTKIVKGEIPSYKVAEDENYYAFLDINPKAPGHTLVIPKQQTDYIFDIDSPVYEGLFVFAKKVAIALREAVPCLRIGVAVLGLEVPHAHIHLVPLQKESDMDVRQPKCDISKEEMLRLCDAIAAEFNKRQA